MRNRSEGSDVGHFFMAIDPELFGPLAEFTARVDRMIMLTKAGGRAENVQEILIPVKAVTYRALLKYSQEAQLDAELVVVENAGA